MRHYQIEKKTSIPQRAVGEFIWARGLSIKSLTRDLNLNNISLVDDSYDDSRSRVKNDENLERVVDISGYPTNVYQAIAEVKYKYREILEWDTMLARRFEIIDWEIIVDLPNWLKWIVTNIREIVSNQIRTALKNVGSNNYFNHDRLWEIQVVDIIMRESAKPKTEELLEPQSPELSDFAEKLLKATGEETVGEKQEKKNNFLNVEILPQITEKTFIDKEQIRHFIWKERKNLKFLQDKFNVILKTRESEIEIIGSEICVIEAKKEIERMYKNTVFEAEIISRSWWFITVKMPNWDEQGIHVSYDDNTLTKWAKIKVIISDKWWHWEKIELIKEDVKKPIKIVPRPVENRSIFDEDRNGIPNEGTFEAKIYCIISDTCVILTLPGWYNKRINIKPDNALKEWAKVKINATRVNGDYENIELI